MTIISPAAGRITSGFGPRDTKNLPAGSSKNHAGVDIAPPKPGQTGVIVYAPRAGRVVEVDTKGKTARGKFVKIAYGKTGKIVFLLQHLASVSVKAGRDVRIGHPVGVMGNTGLQGIGIHLHLEVHENGKPIDPAKYYKAEGGVLGEHPGKGNYTVNVPDKHDRLTLKVYDGPNGPVLHHRDHGFKVGILAIRNSWAITPAGRYYPARLLKKV